MKAIVAKAQSQQEVEAILSEFSSREDIEVLYSNVSGLCLTIVYQVRVAVVIDAWLQQARNVLASTKKLTKKEFQDCQGLLRAVKSLLSNELWKANKATNTIVSNNLLKFGGVAEALMIEVDHKYATRNFSKV